MRADLSARLADFHAVQLIALKDEGFDSSYATAEGVRPRCSRCDAICINGVACHEMGCTNAAQDDDSDDSEYYDAFESLDYDDDCEESESGNQEG